MQIGFTKTYHIPLPSYQSLVYCLRHPLHRQGSLSCHLQYYPEPGEGENEETVMKYSLGLAVKCKM